MSKLGKQYIDLAFFMTQANIYMLLHSLRHSSRQTSFFGMKCDKCHKSYDGVKSSSIKNLRNKVIAKLKIVDGALNLRDGKIPLKDGKDVMKAIVHTSSTQFSPKGQVLRAQISELYRFFHKPVEKKEPLRGSNQWFEQVLRPFFYKYKKVFLNDIVFDILNNTMNRMQGRYNVPVGKRLMNLFHACAQRDPSLTRFISSNMHGPAWRSVQRFSKQFDNSGGQPIINRNVHQMAEIMIAYHKKSFDKTDEVGVSVSIDATKNAELIVPNERFRHYVGCAHPHHYIPFPASTNDNEKDSRAKIEMLNDLVEKVRQKQLFTAAKTKIATVSYQWTKKGMTPYLQLGARPQTKNENSSFNFDVVKALEIAEKTLRSEGYKFSFLCSANDGVSCDSTFVSKHLIEFLQGKRDNSYHTDTNHNVKSSRYQLVLGGNAVKCIGIYLIDCGLLKDAGISQDIFRPKDFASDLLVLMLCSDKTVNKILEHTCVDTHSQITLALTLFFMRAHLTTINMKGKLKPNERISMLWSSFLFLLHVDGVSVVTKRNWASEVISMCFIIMCQLSVRPHRLTSEPSEHSIAIMRRSCREFTVNDFISVVQKISRFHESSTQGDLILCRSNETSGYLATVHHDSRKKSIEIKSGSIKIETDLNVIEAQKEILSDNDVFLSHRIWKVLLPVINKASRTMKSFLKNVFGVEEFHPMILEFTDQENTSELITRLESLFENNDDIFKKEKRIDLSDQETGSKEEISKAFFVAENDDFVINIVEDLLHCVKNNTSDNNTSEGIGDDNNKENIDIDSVDVIGEEFGSVDADVHLWFLKVITARRISAFLENSNIICNAMTKMHLGSREKGSSSSIQKIKSLQGRWFTKNVSTLHSKGEVIQRGSIVSLANNDFKNTFLVYSVFKKDGSKWHPYPKDDNPSWPLDIK